MKTAALQRAIYQRLSGYAPLTAIVSTRVYADAPQENDAGTSWPGPYITIGPFNASAWDTKPGTGSSVVAQVHVWDRPVNGRSQIDARALAEIVYDALHRYVGLNIEGAIQVDCLFEGGAEDIGDPDGKTIHIPLLFRVTYEHKRYSARLRYPVVMAA